MGMRLSSRQRVPPPVPPRKKPSFGPRQIQERRGVWGSLTMAGSSLV